MSAKQTPSEEGLKRILRAIEATNTVKQFDNKKLLWVAMQTKAWTDTPIMTFAEAILSEIENRLYPEFDGEMVVCTEFGWQTPDGEIRYDDIIQLKEQPTPALP